MTIPEKKTFSEVAQQAMTDLNPSQEILRLCKELGVKQPHIRWIGQWPKDIPYLTATALMKWSGWGEWAVRCERFPRGDGTVRFYASATKQSTLGGKLEEEREGDSPDTALQHLAIARLRQIKQEKEDE